MHSGCCALVLVAVFGKAISQLPFRAGTRKLTDRLEIVISREWRYLVPHVVEDMMAALRALATIFVIVFNLRLC